MKTWRCFCSALFALGVTAFVHGQPEQPAQKSAADLASDEFFKLRESRAAAPNEARFDQVIKMGIAFLEAYPEHARAPVVVAALATFGATMPDPKLASHRIAYMGRLNSAIIDFRYKADLSPAALTAAAALDAAARDYEVRVDFSRENLQGLREKIDALTPLPGSGRFLVDRERSFVEILTKGMSPSAGERQLRKLTQHPDPGVAAMARDDLNIVEVRKAPYELKFTALDGKECDVAQLRGKVVALVFWSTANEASTKSLAAVKAVHADYRKQGFEVVGVSFDKAEQRDQLVKFVADNKVTWPVHFDGKEEQNEWAAKLNVRRVPSLVLFNQKGFLVANNLRADRLEGEVKKLLGIKDEAPMEMPSGGSRPRGRR